MVPLSAIILHLFSKAVSHFKCPRWRVEIRATISFPYSKIFHLLARPSIFKFSRCRSREKRLRFVRFTRPIPSCRVASRARFQVCREFHNSLTRVVESAKYKLCNQSRRNFDPLYSATSIKELRESQHSLSSQSLATRTSERAFEKVRCLPLTTDGWACRKSLLLPFGMTTQQCKFLYNRLREFRASFTQPLREKYALLGTGGTSRVSDSRLLPLEVGK